MWNGFCVSPSKSFSEKPQSGFRGRCPTRGRPPVTLGSPFPEHWSLAHRLHLPSCWVNIRIHLPCPLEVVFLFFFFSLRIDARDFVLYQYIVTTSRWAGLRSRPTALTPRDRRMTSSALAKAAQEENRKSGPCSSQGNTLAAPKKRTPRAWGCHPRSRASSPGPGAALSPEASGREPQNRVQSRAHSYEASPAPTGFPICEMSTIRCWYRLHAR